MSNINISKRFNSSLADLTIQNQLNSKSYPASFSSGNPVVKYTNEHEWVALHEDGTAFVGVTKYAADALGDATFVELNEAGSVVEFGETVGAIESVKSASDVYSPAAGEITEVNEKVVEDPSLLNSGPMGEGWLLQIKISNPETDFYTNEELLSLEDYVKSLEGDDH